MKICEFSNYCMHASDTVWLVLDPLRIWIGLEMTKKWILKKNVAFFTWGHVSSPSSSGRMEWWGVDRWEWVIGPVFGDVADVVKVKAWKEVESPVY